MQLDMMNYEQAQSYKFQNVGQFRGLLKSAGYLEEYNDGHLKYTRGDETIQTTLDAIRSKITPEQEYNKNIVQTHENLAKSFDKNDFNQNVLEKQNISLIYQGNGYTVVDHTNKITLPLSSLLDYANKNGYLLDGKGTQLEHLQKTPLQEINGKKGKVVRTKDDLKVFYAKDELSIPDEIFGKFLSKQQKQQLLEGKVVPIRGDKGDIFLQVDKELNQVMIKGNHEIRIPNVVGKSEALNYPGATLTLADKYLLANGENTLPKLIASEKGFILAELKMTADKKGVIFQNMQELTKEQAQKYLPEQSKEQTVLPEQKYFDSFIQSLPKEEREYVTAQLNSPINPNGTLTEKEYIEKNIDKNLQYFAGNHYLNEQIISPEGLAYTNFIQKSINRDFEQKFGEAFEFSEKTATKPSAERNFEKEFTEALQKSDFKKMQNLKEDGYKPSAKFIDDLKVENLPPDNKIAAKTIFGVKSEIKPEVKSVGQAKGKNMEQEKSQQPDKTAHAVKSTVNALFQNM